MKVYTVNCLALTLISSCCPPCSYQGRHYSSQCSLWFRTCESLTYCSSRLSAKDLGGRQCWSQVRAYFPDVTLVEVRHPRH